MDQHRRAPAVLAWIILLCLSRAALTAPLVTVRITSINDLLRDMETIATSSHEPVTRNQVLKDLAVTLGVEDLSFLDLTRPAALAIPQAGSSTAWESFVLAVPVRDGRQALDVLGKQFPERTIDGDLTVFRRVPLDAPEGMGQQALFAALHGHTLVVGHLPEVVRSFDYASALAGENLPSGSLAVSMEIEPVADRLKAGLTEFRRILMSMPGPGTAVPAQRPDGAGSPASGSQAPVAESNGQGGVANQAPGASAAKAGEDMAAVAAGEDADSKPVPVSAGVTPPELIVKVQPEYPEDARRQSIEGKVILEAIIGTDGDVESVKVVRSVPMLDDAAIEAVEQWKYKPALQNGRRVKVLFTVVVDFTLRDFAPGETRPGAAPAQPANTLPFDPRKMAGLFDLYIGFFQDAIDSLARVQLSMEVSDGFLIIHTRGAARQGSTLAGFIEAQRDVGLPAIGRMMPAHAPVIVAGQIFWTDPSRTWLTQLMHRYQSVVSELLQPGPESGPNEDQSLLQGMNLWNSDRMRSCQRGDFALAMEYHPKGMRTLSVSGISDSEPCRGVLETMVGESRRDAGGKAFVETQVLEPEKVTSYVYQVRPPKALDVNAAQDHEAMKMRFAMVRNIIILGTDEWAEKAIREAASVREGSTPVGGGLVLADLGPFTQRPGVFGRLQLGTFLRQAAETSKEQMRRRAENRAKNGETSDGKGRSAGQPARAGSNTGALPEEETKGPPEELIEALEGQAGSIPFAMRFDEGAATIELALPLAMFDAFARNVPKHAADATGKNAPQGVPSPNADGGH